MGGQALCFCHWEIPGSCRDWTQLSAAVATKGPSVRSRAETRAEHTRALSQEAAHPPSLLRTPQKPSCLFFSLNSTIKMDQMSSPIFWVCTPRHERGQSEQSASWVPIPAPAGTWLGLSLGSYTKQGFWHFLAEPKCLFFSCLKNACGITVLVCTKRTDKTA